MRNKIYIKSIFYFFNKTLTNKLRALPSKLPNIIENQTRKYDVSGPIDNLNLIFSANRGLFLLESSKGIITKILNGKYYGLTRYKGYWICARSNIDTAYGPVKEKQNRQSEIIALKIENSIVVDYRVLLWGIPGEIHQLDVIEHNLYIPHTDFNQILIANIKDLLLSSRPKTILSCSSIPLDIFSPSHLNSFFYSKLNNKYYLIAHNSTAHTGRHSEILIFNDLRNNPEIINTFGHSCHNVCYFNNQLIFCDSNNCRLILNDKCIFESEMLLRGLSINDRYILVGGSEVDFTGKGRNTSDSCIYVLTHTGEHVSTIYLNNLGNINEIRQMNEYDYALSN